MNILMLTNTYAPHVNGVAKSVEAIVDEFRRRGHAVLIVAPESAQQPALEEDVIRIAISQQFNASDFSEVLPLSNLLVTQLDRFKPDVIHTHHPYLLGMTALRIARHRKIPIIFTQHALYEQCTHLVPSSAIALKRCVVELVTRYGNLVNHVFTSNEGIAELLRKRGLHTSISVVPKGVDCKLFSNGNGARFRERLKIPTDAFLAGYIGQFAVEKNLVFLTESVCQFLQENANAHFLLSGEGLMDQALITYLQNSGLQTRIHKIPVIDSKQLPDAYSALDVFAFASKSETQSVVLTEAMAAGVPVVALDASGCREIVRDGLNGRLLRTENTASYALALQWVMEQDEIQKKFLKDQALKTAKKYSLKLTADKILAHYQLALADAPYTIVDDHYYQWLRLRLRIKTEWDTFANRTPPTEKYPLAKQPVLN